LSEKGISGMNSRLKVLGRPLYGTSDDTDTFTKLGMPCISMIKS